MKTKLIVRNYRCFQEPARLVVTKGFTAFTGANNSGKSSLLKFFLEFRHLFQTLGSAPQTLIGALKGQRQTAEVAAVRNKDDIFCNANRRDVELEFRFSPDDAGTVPSQADPTKLRITLHRDSDCSWDAELFI